MVGDTAGGTPRAGAASLGNQAVVVSGDNLGSINTGVIINISGDGFEKNLAIGRTILAAALLAPPLDEKRKKAITAIFRAIAKTLTEAASALREGQIPSGKCGELLYYSQQLPSALGDVFGAEQAAALSQKLQESYNVEGFGYQYMQLPEAERNVKFGVLDEAAGYFRAAARSLVLRQTAY